MLQSLDPRAIGEQLQIEGLQLIAARLDGGNKYGIGSDLATIGRGISSLRDADDFQRHARYVGGRKLGTVRGTRCFSQHVSLGGGARVVRRHVPFARSVGDGEEDAHPPSRDSILPIEAVSKKPMSF